MGQPLSATSKQRTALKLTFGLTLGYFIVEAVGAILTNSLALLSDAAHMLTDVGGISLALFAAWMSTKPPTPDKTFGYYRVEILAALTNAVVMFGISGYIFLEAYLRFQAPPEVASGPMLVIASVGLGVNLISIRVLRRGSGDSLNLQGASLEVLGDALGSMAAIAAGLIMLSTRWYYADPVFGVAIGAFILPRAWKLASQALHVLLEGTPAHLDVRMIREAMLGVGGVADVHDLHVWTLTSGVEALSAHVILEEGLQTLDIGGVLERISGTLRGQFGIEHTTIQAEPSTGCCGPNGL